MLRHHTAGMVWAQNHTCPGHLAMVPHTHTQTHTHSLTHTHTCTLRAHTCTHTLVGGHSLTLTEDKKYSLTYVHMHIHTHVPHISTHMHTYTHMHKYTHMHTYTHITCIHTGSIVMHTNMQVPMWCIYNAQVPLWCTQKHTHAIKYENPSQKSYPTQWGQYLFITRCICT